MADIELESRCPDFTPYISLAVTSNLDICRDSILCIYLPTILEVTTTNFRGDGELGALLYNL